MTNLLLNCDFCKKKIFCRLQRFQKLVELFAGTVFPQQTPLELGFCLGDCAPPSAKKDSYP